MQVGSIQGVSSGAAVAKTLSAASYDPRDTNQDGVVSATEALVYAMQHPELTATATASATPVNQYNAAGALAATGGSGSTQFDQYA